MKYARRDSLGVTLVELIVVLAILGVVLALAAPAMADMLNRRRVQMVADQMMTDLAYARSESSVATAMVDAKFMSNATQSCYTLTHFDYVGDCDCTRGPGSACNGDITNANFTTLREIRTVQMMASSGVSFVSTGSWDALSTNRVRFVRPQMTPTVPDFAVNVVGNRGFTLRVRLNAMGRVSQCSPDGTMPGAAAC